jgi:hypothetical protein
LDFEPRMNPRLTKLCIMYRARSMRFEFNRWYDINRYRYTGNGAMSKSNTDHQHFKLGCETVGLTKTNQEAFTHSSSMSECSVVWQRVILLARQLQSNELENNSFLLQRCFTLSPIRSSRESSYVGGQGVRCWKLHCWRVWQSAVDFIVLVSGKLGHSLQNSPTSFLGQ